MTREFVRVSADASLWKAHQLAEHAAVEHIPVLDGPKLIGMISRTELAIAVAQLTDALTGLPTSAYIRDQIQSMWQIGQAATLIFVDINRCAGVGTGSWTRLKLSVAPLMGATVAGPPKARTKVQRPGL